jgi:hypothetical protein
LDGPAATLERVITASVAIGSIGVPFLHITEVRISIPVIAVVGARRAAR